MNISLELIVLRTSTYRTSFSSTRIMVPEISIESDAVASLFLKLVNYLADMLIASENCSNSIGIFDNSVGHHLVLTVQNLSSGADNYPGVGDVVSSWQSAPTRTPDPVAVVTGDATVERIGARV